jgi:hypothetical protein
MARLIDPRGASVFKRKKGVPFRPQTTKDLTRLSAADIMNMISVADRIGKSEAINAAIGGTGELIESAGKAAAEAVGGVIGKVADAGDDVTVTDFEENVDKVGPGAAVSKPQEKPDPTAPGAPPPSAPVPPAGDVPTPPPSPAGQVQEAAKKRVAAKQPPLVKVKLTPQPQMQPQAQPQVADIPVPQFAPTEKTPEAYAFAFTDFTANFKPTKEPFDAQTAAERNAIFAQRKHNRAVRQTLIQAISGLTPTQAAVWKQGALQAHANEPSKVKLINDVAQTVDQSRKAQRRGSLGTKQIQVPGPGTARPPQAPPPSAVPGPETTRGTPARGAVDVSSPTAKDMRTAALRAGTTAGEQAAREIAREAPADAAPVTSLEGFIKKYAKKPTGEPVREVQQRPAERELTFKEFVAQRPTAPAVVVPEKVSYRQLLSLARKARTPEDQANILGAYDRASGKSRPRTLVERYNRAHEQRDINRLTKFFPAIKKQTTAAEQYYKLKRAQLQEALAATQRSKQMLLQEKAQLTATQEEDLRRRVEAGSPEAKVAYQFALAQQAVQAAGTSAEKARRNRELLELEKAAVAATTTQKLAAAYKQLRRRGGGKGKGRRGQKYKPLTENQEANLKYRAQQDSINAQKAMITRIRKKINQKAQAQSVVNSLSDAAIMRVDPSVQGRLISQRTQAQAVLDSLKSDPEASSATLTTAVAVLRNMQAVSQKELNEILSRKTAIPAAQVSVPAAGPIAGPKKKPEDK